jgi:DNA-binding CsgD family transcriptional regulator
MQSTTISSTRTSGNGGLSGPLPLVGREQELAALEALLKTSDPEASLVIVSGEGGVGKSRLAAEFAGRAEGRGWQVAWGRSYPVETGVPYALFSDAFLPILDEMDSATLNNFSRGGEAELRFLFPALERSGEALDPDAAGDPEEFRTRLMWNFAEFVRRYAKNRGPLLIVLEDLQWADESSIQLLHFLARQGSGKPVFIVCTYNDAERDRSPQLIQAERSLVSMGVAEVQHLEPLSREQVTELLTLTFGVDAGVVREFSPLLFGWTRGNPFFLEEIVKSLVSSGRLSKEKGTWTGWDADDFSLPGSIRDAVIARLASFPDRAQTVADWAAIVGARSTYPLLASVSDLDEADLLSALEELVSHRVLNERVEGGEVVYTFTHPLVRQTLYDGFSLQRARLLHGLVAQAMEEYYGPRAMEHADELAYHFARTDGGKLGAKATQYLAAAGMSALDRRADHEAVSYLHEALQRAESEHTDGAPSRAELLPPLARAYQHMGDFDEAGRLWTGVLEGLSSEDPAEPALQRAVGMSHFWCGRHAEAHRHLDAGLEAAEALGDQAGIIRLRVSKAHCLHELGQGAAAEQTVSPALPLAEELGDPALLARVHRSLALLHVWIGPPEKALEHAERAIELAQEVGDLSIEFWARWAIAVIEGMRGKTDHLSSAIEKIRDIAKRARSPVLQLWIADVAIELAYGRGDWDEGVAEGQRAIALARSLNQRTLLPRLLVWTSQFYVGRGQVEEAKALVDEAVEVSGLDRDDATLDVHRVVPSYIGLANYLVGTGDYHDAIEAAEKGLRIAEGTGYTLWAVHRLLPILAEACLWAGELDRAEEVGTQMRAHSERLDHRLGIAWADACDALARWKRGDPETSVDLMREAAEELEAIPMIPYAARLRRQMAGRLAEIGDIEGSVEELRQVHDTFVKLGAHLELEKTRMMFKEVGHRPPPKGVGEGMAGLTGRELEIARLVARRQSNKAIAKALGNAPRTVSTHLSNIYKKLGIGTRGELADLVREWGLLES